MLQKATRGWKRSGILSRLFRAVRAHGVRNVLAEIRVYGVRNLLVHQMPGVLSPTSPRKILTNPYVAGKLLSLENGRGYIIVGPHDPETPAPAIGIDGLPVPPTIHLRFGYGASPEGYVASGQCDVEKMLDVLRLAAMPPESLQRVLEVGCGAGRMLRHMPRLTGASENWGVEISAEHVAWCQQNLSPPLSVVTTTTAPHLPFEDNYFDLVYCGSVFTHISDLADAWFLEIRRVLRPGGHAYITIHDEVIVQWLMSKGLSDPWMGALAGMLMNFDRRTGALSRAYDWFSLEADARTQTQVFYSASYLIKKWSAWMTFVSRTPEAYSQQTALLFKK
jgi:ubiquinone/menaquinone biosynthesis C-methylase UbiE